MSKQGTFKIMNPCKSDEATLQRPFNIIKIAMKFFKNIFLYILVPSALTVEYYPIKKFLIYSEANNACKSDGKILAFIKSEKEMTNLIKNLKKFVKEQSLTNSDEISYFWIGLSRPMWTNAWGWDIGSKARIKYFV